jgi:hypothetical protein
MTLILKSRSRRVARPPGTAKEIGVWVKTKPMSILKIILKVHPSIPERVEVKITLKEEGDQMKDPASSAEKPGLSKV